MADGDGFAGFAGDVATLLEEARRQAAMLTKGAAPCRHAAAPTFS